MSDKPPQAPKRCPTVADPRCLLSIDTVFLLVPAGTLGNWDNVLKKGGLGMVRFWTALTSRILHQIGQMCNLLHNSEANSMPYHLEFFPEQQTRSVKHIFFGYLAWNGVGATRIVGRVLGSVEHFLRGRFRCGANI